MTAPTHLFAALLASLLCAASGLVLACSAAGARCAGAAGFPAVPWVGCCSGDCDVVKPGHWGKFCADAAGSPAPAPADCYETGERAQGAPGHPPVEWKPCCAPGDVQAAKAGDWGSFCTAGGAEAQEDCVGAACGKPRPCYATGERAQGAPGYPPYLVKPCCVQTDVQVEKAGTWGKFCMAA